MMFDAQQIAALQERDFITRAAARLEGACGQEIVQAMQDPEICEIMLNCDGLLFVEVIGSGMQEAGCVDRQAAFTIAKTLASLTGQVLDPEHPLLGAEIPFNGSRIEIQIPPVVKAPSFTIRKHNALDLPLASLIDAQMLTSSQADLLRQAMLQRRSIVVSGATGCGKTTLVNALLNELAVLCPEDRIVCVEDTAELKVQTANRLHLLTAPGVGMDALLRSALRSRPDRIVVGEVRGPEALDLIDAFSTGHRGGLTTLHAGSVQQALKRLQLLVSRHPSAPRKIEPAVADALDLIVQLERRPQRHVAEIAEVTACTEEGWITRSLLSLPAAEAVPLQAAEQWPAAGAASRAAAASNESHAAVPAASPRECSAAG